MNLMHHKAAGFLVGTSVRFRCYFTVTPTVVMSAATEVKLVHLQHLHLFLEDIVITFIQLAVIDVSISLRDLNIFVSRKRLC